MARQKAYFSVMLIIFTYALSSCKKRLQKKPTTVVIEITNPVTDEGFGNVKFKVVESEDQNPDAIINHNFEPTEDSPVYEGATDNDGYAVFQFYKKKHSDFMYAVTLDYSEMNAPDVDYEVSGGQTHLINPTDYVVNITNSILPYGKYRMHIKDTSCLTTNDNMRYKIISTPTPAFLGNQSYDYWLPEHWQSPIGNEYFENCYDGQVGSPIRQTTEYILTKKEVIRDGQTFIYLDTFLIKPDIIDTLKLYY